MAIIITDTQRLVVEDCISCGVKFAMPESLQQRCQNDPQKPFYCPNGHRMTYRWSVEVRARQEAEKKMVAAQQKLNEEYIRSQQLEATIKVQERKLKRLTNGVCPCCNRTFSNLHNHMKKQHPEAIIPNNKPSTK